MLSQGGLPDEVEILSLLIVLGTSHSAPPFTLGKPHPSFYNSKHFQCCGGGFADTSAKRR